MLENRAVLSRWLSRDNLISQFLTLGSGFCSCQTILMQNSLSNRVMNTATKRWENFWKILLWNSAAKLIKLAATQRNKTTRCSSTASWGRSCSAINKGLQKFGMMNRHQDSHMLQLTIMDNWMKRMFCWPQRHTKKKSKCRNVVVATMGIWCRRGHFLVTKMPLHPPALPFFNDHFRRFFFLCQQMG